MGIGGWRTDRWRPDRRGSWLAIVALLFGACAVGAIGESQDGAAVGGGSTAVGGGGGGCASVSCTAACPGERWDEVDGCPSCACAPSAMEMVVDGTARSTDHVTVQVAASEYDGAIDRWVFDFTWSQDDPTVDDDEEEVTLTVRLQRSNPKYEPGEANASYRCPEDDQHPLEVIQPWYATTGATAESHQLAPTVGVFSIRRVDDTFEGGVRLDLDGVGGGATHAVQVSAPFSVPVP